MTKKFSTVSQNSTVNDAAGIMKNLNVGAVPVCKNNKIIGMLSLGDIAVKQKSDMEASGALSSISIPSKLNKKYLKQANLIIKGWPLIYFKK
ncbi:MAG: CBS domain-containing protein, partial [bacterium]